MGKKSSDKDKKPETVSFARVPNGKWPEALKRLRDEVERASRITAEDLKVVVNT